MSTGRPQANPLTAFVVHYLQRATAALEPLRKALAAAQALPEGADKLKAVAGATKALELPPVDEVEGRARRLIDALVAIADATPHHALLEVPEFPGLSWTHGLEALLSRTVGTHAAPGSVTVVRAKKAKHAKTPLQERIEECKKLYGRLDGTLTAPRDVKLTEEQQKVLSEVRAHILGGGQPHPTKADWEVWLARCVQALEHPVHPLPVGTRRLVDRTKELEKKLKETRQQHGAGTVTETVTITPTLQQDELALLTAMGAFQNWMPAVADDDQLGRLQGILLGRRETDAAAPTTPAPKTGDSGSEPGGAGSTPGAGSTNPGNTPPKA